jgi:hypothetical protein
MPPAATTSAQALSNLQTAQAGQKSPDQLYQQESSALGIPGAQQQVSGLRGAINNTTSLLSQVAPSVMGRTANSLVTSAQANAQIANGQAPLNTQLNQEQQAYSGANADLTNLTNEAGTLTGNAVTGQQNQLSYLQGIYSDLASSEQQAKANALAQEQLAASKASGGIGGLVGGGTGTTAPTTTPTAPGGGFTATKNSVGGYSFSSAAGQPATMAQYLAGQRLSGTGLLQRAAAMLSQGSQGDRGIANAISSGRYTPAQLEQLYPQVFGGL